MSDGIIIALIGLFGTLIGAAIGAFATIKAADHKANPEGVNGRSRHISCALIGLISSLAAAIGLVLGVLFATQVLQSLDNNSVTPQATYYIQSQPEMTTYTNRADTLIGYDEIYNQNGWCALWVKLINDDLVTGECPQSVAQLPKAEDISGPNGNPIYAAQIRISSDIQINHPACVTFSESAATAEGGKTLSWVNNDFIGTNLTMKAGSFFTVFFRCEETITP